MLQISIAVDSRIIWCINAQNDGTGSEEIGNYDVEVYGIDRGTCAKIIAKQERCFRIEGFEKAKGALELAQAIISQFKAGQDALPAIERKVS